jgi:hypothetical protein
MNAARCIDEPKLKQINKNAHMQVKQAIICNLIDFIYQSSIIKGTIYIDTKSPTRPGLEKSK